MIDSRWLRTVCILVVVAGFLPGFAAAQTFPTTNNSGSAAPQPLDVLNDLNSAPDARDIAALQLVAPRDSMAHSMVMDVFRSGPEESKLALAKALATVSWPDPEFEAPLMALLGGRDQAPTAAAAALAQYRDDPQVMKALITQAKTGRADIRIPAIGALGAFGYREAAQELVDLLEHGVLGSPDSEEVREAAGDALLEMTGRSDLDHNALQWDQWWQKNQNLADNDFHKMIVQSRGEAFEEQLAHYKALWSATKDLLTRTFWSAPQDRQAGILLGYLQSQAPEIRAWGANLVLLSVKNQGRAPAGTIQQTEALLGDPSPMVRAAAAEALQADYDSSPALVEQLKRETDDLVRVRILRSLAGRPSLPAIDEMLNLVGSGQSDMVRIAAADGLAAGSDQINADTSSKLKQNAIDTLKQALKDTEAPVEAELRAAIVGALSGISDQQLSDVFTPLILPNESREVRARALEGLGNLPKPDQYSSQIARIMEEEDDATLRLAAVKALQHVPPESYIKPMLDRMTTDSSDQVREQAWDVLQGWANEPNLDEQALSRIASGLSADPVKQLQILKILCNRLSADAKNASLPDDRRKQAAQQLAEQQQNMGDLLKNEAVNQPLQAAEAYKSALGYWKANGGRPEVVNGLCQDVVRAYLSAKQWGDAANFAAEVVRDYGNDANLKGALPAVADEFVFKAAEMQTSQDPAAYTDAMAMFDALQKMTPPLPGDYPDRLEIKRRAIEAQHAASSRPGA